MRWPQLLQNAVPVPGAAQLPQNFCPVATGGESETTAVTVQPIATICEMEAGEMEMYWRDEKPKPRPLMRSQLRKMSQSEGAGDESGQHPLAHISYHSLKLVGVQEKTLIHHQ